MPDLSLLNVNSTAIDLMKNFQDVIINVPKVTVYKEVDTAFLSFIFCLFVVHFMCSRYLFSKYYEKTFEAKPVEKTGPEDRATFRLDNEHFLIIKTDHRSYARYSEMVLNRD